MNITNFVNENSVICCSNREDVKLLAKLLHEAGYRWCNGEYYTNHMNWDTYKEESCYYIYNGVYSPKSYYSGKRDIYDFAKIKYLNTNFMTANSIKKIYERKN
jgi:hypothetical protein